MTIVIPWWPPWWHYNWISSPNNFSCKRQKAWTQNTLQLWLHTSKSYRIVDHDNPNCVFERWIQVNQALNKVKKGLHHTTWKVHLCTSTRVPFPEYILRVMLMVECLMQCQQVTNFYWRNNNISLWLHWQILQWVDSRESSLEPKNLKTIPQSHLYSDRKFI